MAKNNVIVYFCKFKDAENITLQQYLRISNLAIKSSALENLKT